MHRLSPDEKSELIAALAEQGVPENIARYAVDQEPRKGPYWRTSLFTFLLMPAGFVVGGYGLLAPIEALNNRLAAANAESTGALLYSTNFGVCFLLALFGWILMLMPIAAGLQLLSRPRRISSFVFGMLDSNSGFSWFKQPDKDLSPDQYIKAFFRRMAKLWFVPAAILFTLAVSVGLREVFTFKTFGETAFTSSRLLSLSGPQTYDFDDIRYVEVGCNHTTGKNASDNLIYRIRFVGGETISMENTTPLNGNWLESAIKIDNALNAAGVKFKRWSWLKRNPLHPACLEAQSRLYTPKEYQQVLSLIRADDF